MKVNVKAKDFLAYLENRINITKLADIETRFGSDDVIIEAEMVCVKDEYKTCGIDKRKSLNRFYNLPLQCRDCPFKEEVENA